MFLLMDILSGPVSASDGMPGTVGLCKFDSEDADAICHFELVIGAQGYYA